MTREEFFEKLTNGAKWDVGVAINRTNPVPLDANSVFESLDALTTYATTNALAYPGQVVSVLGTEEIAAYLIKTTGEGALISKLAASSTSGDIADDVAKLQTQVANIINGTQVVGAATKATQDGEGNVISTTYATAAALGDVKTTAEKGVSDAAAAKAVADAAKEAADAKVGAVSLASGVANGTVKLTVDGVDTEVAVKGLGSAAYTESTAYATAAQGTKADNAMPKAGGTFTGAITVQAPTAEMNPATKQYVDTAINTVKQFEYQVVDELPTASQATMGKIYLVAHSHNPNDGQPDSYDEFITVLSGSTYKWERIGNTDIDLSGYVPTTRKINGKALTSDITLGAADVGVNETAFPGLKKVGTVTGVKMNAGSVISPDASGVVDLGTVITDISGKQDKLTADQLLAVNSGITATKVEQYDGYATGKQDALSTTQLAAVDSGITTAKVGQYDGYATSKQDKIDADHKISADFVSGLGAAAKKGVASSVTAAGVDLPTAAAVASYVGAEIDKISIPTVNNAALKDASGATIFTANASADVQILVIDCGNASGWDA